MGFVFAKSPRRVTIAKAKSIIKKLKARTAKVGVFVNESPARIRRIALTAGLTAVQLHGDETPKTVDALKGLRRIKAVRVGQNFKRTDAERFNAEAYLFDTKVKGLYGGSGLRFDWKKLKGKHFKRPVILSGGLDAGNVSRAVKMLKPYAVDVSSGVEKAPGIKDAKKIREFIRNAKKN